VRWRSCDPLVSLARSSEPDVRVSKHPALHRSVSPGSCGGPGRCLLPWCGDVLAPVAVASDRHGCRVEERRFTLCRPLPGVVSGV